MVPPWGMLPFAAAAVLLSPGLPGVHAQGPTGAPPTTAPATDAPDANATVRLVGVGVFLRALGNVDLKTGGSSVDYNLYLRQSKERYVNRMDADAALLEGADCENGRPCVCPPGLEDEWEEYVPADALFENVNFVNIDRLHKITPVRSPKTKRLAYFRIQGNYIFDPDLAHWPFDKQNIQIEIEDLLATTPTEEIPVRFCHLTRYSGMSPTGRYFPGMDARPGARPWSVSLGSVCWPALENPYDFADEQCDNNGVSSNDVPYPLSRLPDAGPSCTCLGGEQASSRYTFSVPFTRPRSTAFLKYFLPPMFITMVNLGVWFLHPEKGDTRLGVCGSSLVSEVMYHVSLAQSNPDTSVITLSDRFMVVVYFNTVSSFIVVFLQIVLLQGKFRSITWQFFRITRAVGPLSSLVNFVGVLIFDQLRWVLLWVACASVLSSCIVPFFLHATEEHVDDIVAIVREADTELKNRPRISPKSRKHRRSSSVNGNSPTNVDDLDGFPRSHTAPNEPVP